MGDYIRREDAYPYESRSTEMFVADGWLADPVFVPLFEVNEHIANVPAADVRENVRGEWTGESDGYADGYLVFDRWNCSVCGYIVDDDEPPRWHFCPNCGADMRKVDSPDLLTKNERNAYAVLLKMSLQDETSDEFTKT